MKRRIQTVLDPTVARAVPEDVIDADPLNQANPSGGADGGTGSDNILVNEQRGGQVQEVGDDNNNGGGPEVVVVEVGHERVNEERPLTPPIHLVQDDAPRDSRPPASDGECIYSNFLC